MRGTRFTRRRAVAAGAALALAGQGGWWETARADDALAASSPLERVSIAILGCGIRGPAHAEELLNARHGAYVSWVCDPDRSRAEKLADQIALKQTSRPRVASDLRTPLDDASLDAVTVATPNHWHALAAILAMEAGKHAYVEKPVCHSIEEGQRLAATAARTGRVCQGGTQARSLPCLREARAFLAAGGIGKPTLARILYTSHRAPIGGPGAFQPPAGVNYDLFCGPAPLAPLSRPQFHYDWHWFWATGDGDLGNNGIHFLDAARNLLDLSGPGSATLSFGTRAGYADAAETPHTQTSLTLFPDVTLVTEIRNLKEVADVDGLGTGVQIHGTEGSVVWKSQSPEVTVLDREGMPVKTIPGDGNHFEKHVANFLAAVRAHDPRLLAAEIGEGVQSTALCHLGNISYRLGEEIPFAAVAERIEARQPKDDAARVVDRVRRMLLANGCAPAGDTIRCGEWVETIADNVTSAAALTTDRGPVLVEGPARDLEWLDYRRPFLLPQARG
jgi:predicted dehydrogenase